MLAMLGMYVQALVTGKGPVSNWLEHLADPSSANGFAFATKFAPTLLASDASARSGTPPPKPRTSSRDADAKPGRSLGVPPHWRVALSQKVHPPVPGPQPSLELLMWPRTSMSGCPEPRGNSRSPGRYETPFEAPLEAQRPRTSPKVAERRGTMPARTPSNFLEKR